MLKIQVIGYCGKDAVVQQHGTESVINFSVCHTDKYKDASGQKYEKATWVNCSWWLENTNIAQYLKKGTLVWVEGIPEAKQWKNKQTGETNPYLNMRVARVELLGGKRENQSGQQQQQQSDNDNTGGYAPMTMNGSVTDDDVPF